MICQTSGINHLSGPPLELPPDYVNMLTFIQKNAFSKFLAPQNYTHPASKIFSKLEVSKYLLTYFVNKDTGVNPENVYTLKSPQDLRPLIKNLRLWITRHHLTPEEVIHATQLSPRSMSLLKGHIPADPNLKALAIIMHMVDFPGSFSIQPVTGDLTKGVN